MEFIWVFYKRDWIFEPDEERGAWYQITHSQAQDLLYRRGFHNASKAIKKMMAICNTNTNESLIVGKTLLKMECYHTKGEFYEC